MRWAVVSLVLVCLLGLAAVGGELSGRVDFRFHVDAYRGLFSPQAALILEYCLSDWTFGAATEFGYPYWQYPGSQQVVFFGPYSAGLTGLTFGARGVMRALQYASYMRFDVALTGVRADTIANRYRVSAKTDAPPSLTSLSQPTFREWWNLAWTSIAGVDVWAMWGIENTEWQFGGIASGSVNTTGIAPMVCATNYGQTDSHFGYTFGVHGVAGDLEVWAEADFGAGHLAVDMARWGYDLNLIASTWLDCSWGHMDGLCDTSFKNLWVIATYPFGCASLISTLAISCSGFDSMSFGVDDVRFGAAWFYIDYAQIRFETDEKEWSLDLDLVVPEVLCIQPHFGWNLDQPGSDTSTLIDSIVLAGLSMECDWNGIKFLFAERFRTGESDSSDFFNITTDARLWSKVADREPLKGYPCWNPCLERDAIDEAFGIEVQSDACCGGRQTAGIYVFFDHELNDVSLFDWHHVRAALNIGITQSFSVGMAAVFDYAMYSPALFTFRFGYEWGTLRIFDFDFFRCLDITT